MKNIWIFILFLFSCQTYPQDVPQKNLYNTDDIVFDKTRDDSSFKCCHSENKIYQYFNLGEAIQFKGGKPALEKIFREKYKLRTMDEGFVRIRFIVNCKGETDRFRVLSAGRDWKEKDFSNRCIQKLLGITKSLDQWLPKHNDDGPVDYYQYLIFKFEKGQIIKILP